MNTCPCCDNKLLRHARSAGVYWFCPHCWQEMPDLPDAIAGQEKRRLQVAQLERLVTHNVGLSNLAPR